MEGFEGVTVAGDSGFLPSVLELAAKTKPDVVVIDFNWRIGNAADIQRELAKAAPAAKMLALTVVRGNEAIARAQREGVQGYLTKDAGPDELREALSAVAEGKSYVGAMAREGLDSKTLISLTPRQREVLQLIAEGKNTREIARLLNVSVKTIETHRAQLMDKTGIHDVPGLVRLALRIGLVALDG